MEKLFKSLQKQQDTCKACNRNIADWKEGKLVICPHCGARIKHEFYCPKCNDYFEEKLKNRINDEKYDWFQNMVQHHIYEHNTTMGKLESNDEFKYKKNFQYVSNDYIKKKAEITATNVTVKRHMSFLIEHGFTVEDLQKCSVIPKTLELYKKCLLKTNVLKGKQNV